MDRRYFFKLTAAGAAALGLTGPLELFSEEKPEEFDDLILKCVLITTEGLEVAAAWVPFEVKSDLEQVGDGCRAELCVVGRWHVGRMEFDAVLSHIRVFLPSPWDEFAGPYRDVYLSEFVVVQRDWTLEVAGLDINAVGPYGFIEPLTNV